MSTETVITLAIGSLVTVAVGYLFFALQAKRSKSADLERVEMANDDYVNSLVRMLVLNTDLGTIDNIVLLFLRKARQYRVDPKHMIAPLQAVNDVYARIMENDYISREKKRAVLKAMSEFNSKESKKKFRFESYTAPQLPEVNPILERYSMLGGLSVGAIITAIVGYTLADLFEHINGLQMFPVIMMFLSFFIVAAAFASLLIDQALEKLKPAVSLEEVADKDEGGRDALPSSSTKRRRRSSQSK